MTTKDIDNRKILESNWTRSTPGLTQPKVKPFDASFPS